MKQTLIILAMSSIVAYGQERNALKSKYYPSMKFSDTQSRYEFDKIQEMLIRIKNDTFWEIKEPIKPIKPAYLQQVLDTQRIKWIQSMYNPPIEFTEHKQPKYKDLLLKTIDGMAIERIMWGVIDSTLTIRLIDSNEKQTTMRYKLIETK